MANQPSSNPDQQAAMWIIGFIVLLGIVWVARKAGEEQATKAQYDKIINADVDRRNGWKPGTTAELNR